MTSPDLDRRRAPGARHVELRDRAPWWGGDLQTIRNQLISRPVPLPGASHALDIPLADGTGDRLTGSIERPQELRPGAPLVLLVHGLTGSAESTYVRESARFHLTRGRPVLRLNLRGAGSSRPLAKGYYHAGRFQDLAATLAHLKPDDAPAGVFAIGFSLGGNILLNLLGGRDRPPNLKGAATVSAPIEPARAAHRIMAARNTLYHGFLLARMKRDVLASPALSDDERRTIAAARTIYEFDDRWVAPANGFQNAEDYYARTAGVRCLAGIGIPTLLLHAANDPWIPVGSYEALRLEPSAPLEVVIASSGGHVGFHEHGFSETWHDRTIDAFIDAEVNAERGTAWRSRDLAPD